MNVSEIYKNIGQAVVDSIQEEFLRAILNIEYVGSVGTELIYINTDNKEKSEWIESEIDVEENIIELHKITTEGGDNKWNRAIFTLNSDYSFDMEFIWDQELQDEVESYIEK